MLERLEDRTLLAAAPTASILAAATGTAPARIMENLGRGVAVVRSSNTQALVSWRLLALDPGNLGFNVYRSANGANPVKLNASPLTAGTNYTDGTVNFAATNVYHVRPVLNGVEQAPSGSFTLKPNTPVEPVIRVPLRNPGADVRTKFVWVGDLDGDGEYDFVIDRLPTAGNQRLEAYKRDGTFLWEIDLGPTSTNTYNIEPGAATISVGHWDGVTVYDMDSDGKAEVLLKTANGTRFADGAVVSAPNDNIQFISVVNGMTGAERARLQFGNDYIADGAMGMQVGVGYLDGVNPSFVVSAKNRVGSGGFNMTVAAYRFDGTNLWRQWKWNRGNSNAPDGHQIRIIDLDGDGKDEVTHIGFALNSNGTLRYSLNLTGGVVHGDRYHIGDFDPDRPGLEGYGVQQENSSLLYDYYYDANTGQMLWQHFASSLVDVGRGMAADVDPRHRGYEVWAFQGTYNASKNLQVSTSQPYPQLGVWWDGDLLRENRNDGKIDKWNYQNSTLGRLVTEWHFDSVEEGSLPMFYGDIWGDWREEIVTFNNGYSALTVFSTNTASPHRLYTLAQNPAYRNSMTVKGYMQAHQVDYYLGDGMTTPPIPNIIYAGNQAKTFQHKYQAETSVRSANAVIESNFAGFNGSGFVNYPTTGGSTRWDKVDGGAGGFTEIRFRFALNAASRTGRLTVNGVSQNLIFDNTGAWNGWSLASLYVPLNAGLTNTILLESTGNDLGNVDELQVNAIIPPAPTLQSIVVNDGSKQRSSVTSLTVTFSGPVKLAPGALTLTGASGDVALVITNPSGDGRTFLVNFTGPGTSAGSLANGVYSLALNAALVTDNFNQIVGGGNRTTSLHRLQGDINGDGSVDAFDINILTGSWQTPTTGGIAAGDLNLDGTVDAFDLNMLTAYWQTKYVLP